MVLVITSVVKIISYKSTIILVVLIMENINVQKLY